MSFNAFLILCYNSIEIKFSSYIEEGLEREEIKDEEKLMIDGRLGKYEGGGGRITVGNEGEWEGLEYFMSRHMVYFPGGFKTSFSFNRFKYILLILCVP